MYPKLIKPYVRSFCRGISRADPIWVPCQPAPDKPLLECFSIVPEHITAHGGIQHLGWAIWEWRKVLIEAEFHAVWEHPSGELFDLTPRAFSLEKILFLPDPYKKYRGLRIDNIRKALTRDKDIERFIVLHGCLFAETNRTVLPDYYGIFEGSSKAMAIRYEMEILEARLRVRFGAPGTTT